MNSVFARSVDWKIIPESPLTGVERPRVEKKEPQYYDEEEAQRVIEALLKEPLMWRLLVLGAMIGGFRRGELLALEWADVNFDEMTITVSKSISLTKDGQPIVKKPKTKSSISKIDMPVWYMAEMEQYKHEWEEQKKPPGINGKAETISMCSTIWENPFIIPPHPLGGGGSSNGMACDTSASTICVTAQPRC